MRTGKGSFRADSPRIEPEEKEIGKNQHPFSEFCYI